MLREASQIVLLHEGAFLINIYHDLCVTCELELSFYFCNAENASLVYIMWKLELLFYLLGAHAFVWRTCFFHNLPYMF